MASACGPGGPQAWVLRVSCDSARPVGWAFPLALLKSDPGRGTHGGEGGKRGTDLRRFGTASLDRTHLSHEGIGVPRSLPHPRGTKTASVRAYRPRGRRPDPDPSGTEQVPRVATLRRGKDGTPPARAHPVPYDTRRNPLLLVVVQAVGGSSPLAHPSRKPRLPSGVWCPWDCLGTPVRLAPAGRCPHYRPQNTLELTRAPALENARRVGWPGTWSGGQSARGYTHALGRGPSTRPSTSLRPSARRWQSTRRRSAAPPTFGARRS
jgi:hypothetical protein